VLSVAPPARGDGSVDVFPRHYRPDFAGDDVERCDYGRHIVKSENYVQEGVK
jgi:hypothetical protein